MDLFDLVEEAADNLRRGAPSVLLNVRLPDDEEVVAETAASRLQTILSNLLSNAAKYGGDLAPYRRHPCARQRGGYPGN